MPTDGKEVLLTELETDVLSAFVKRKILSDAQIVAVLKVLINKLEGTHGS